MSGHARRRACVTILSALLLAVGAGGCAQYGARTVDVTFDSKPQGATAYLVPLRDWDTGGGEKGMLNAASLEPHRLKGGVTPVPATVRSHRAVYVVNYGGKFEWQFVSPLENGKQFTIAVQGAH